jgi:hypothetical protein
MIPGMRELDADGFAGELTSLAPPRPARTLAPRLAAAVRIGVRAGLLPAAAVFAIYFLAHHALPMPWVRIASVLAIYGPAVGVLLAVLTELLVIGLDRVARAGHGLVAVANPVTAGALAGALAGVIPGAVGVTVFGSYTGPFVGTGLIAGALITGSMLVAVPLARRARRERWPLLAKAPDAREGRVIAAAAGIATLILCAVAAVIAPIIVHSAFARTLSGTLAETGPTVGAIAGAIGGGIVGIFVGLVIALGRSLRPPR